MSDSVWHACISVVSSKRGLQVTKEGINCMFNRNFSQSLWLWSRLLRNRFTDLEEQGAEEPALSVFQMTSALTRSQAAKLFYQICGMLYRIACAASLVIHY